MGALIKKGRINFMRRGNHFPLWVGWVIALFLFGCGALNFRGINGLVVRSSPNDWVLPPVPLPIRESIIQQYRLGR